MHRRAIYRFRRAARGERSAEAIDRFPQTASTVDKYNCVRPRTVIFPGDVHRYHLIKRFSYFFVLVVPVKGLALIGRAFGVSDITIQRALRNTHP